MKSVPLPNLYKTWAWDILLCIVYSKPNNDVSLKPPIHPSIINPLVSRAFDHKLDAKNLDKESSYTIKENNTPTTRESVI